MPAKDPNEYSKHYYLTHTEEMRKKNLDNYYMKVYGCTREEHKARRARLGLD